MRYSNVPSSRVPSFTMSSGKNVLVQGFAGVVRAQFWCSLRLITENRRRCVSQSCSKAMSDVSIPLCTNVSPRLSRLVKQGGPIDIYASCTSRLCGFWLGDIGLLSLHPSTSSEELRERLMSPG